MKRSDCWLKFLVFYDELGIGLADSRIPRIIFAGKALTPLDGESISGPKFYP